jgi:hypothetical protein
MLNELFEMLVDLSGQTSTVILQNKPHFGNIFDADFGVGTEIFPEF